MRPTRKPILIFLILAVLVIRLFAGQTFILSAIERSELHSGVCLLADPQCGLTEAHQVDLGESPTHELNLTYHLLGNLISDQGFAVNAPWLNFALRPMVAKMLLALLAASIFHPPKT